jgi:aspartyl protease family protein
MRRLTIAIGLIALIAVLNSLFPYALQDENTRMRALYLVLLLTLVLGGGRAFRGRPVSRVARDAGIWGAILALLVFAYSFRDEFGHSRLIAELMPSRVQVNEDGSLSIRASDGGHFYAEGEVNGVPVRFLVDTGASDVVLAPDDARRAGLEPGTLDYTRYSTTANGVGKGAPVTLASLKVGRITLERMPATVNQVWMHDSLLGMSFLKRLRGFRVEGNTLVLMP